MKEQFTNFISSMASRDRRVIQLIFIVISIILFVLGAGAPDAGGGVGISWGGGYGG